MGINVLSAGFEKFMNLYNGNMLSAIALSLSVQASEERAWVSRVFMAWGLREI